MSNSFPTPWSVACHAPLFVGFVRQEYWSGLPFPSPGDLPDPRIEPESPPLHADSESPWKPLRIQSCSVTQLCPTLCTPVDWSTMGFPVLHYLPQFAQTHVHWIDDAIQPSHPLSCLTPPPLQSFPTSGSFPMSQLFESGGQCIRVSDSKSVLPMNSQEWSLLGWTGWISLPSKGLSRVFSNTTVQKHHFFSTQLSL